MRCCAWSDDEPKVQVHHGDHDDDCGDDCHAVCASCDYGLCALCGEEVSA